MDERLSIPELMQ